MMRGRANGFTIVELLIVVVVIAILAAITIVAYNGIQNSAKTSQAVTAAATYVKAIRSYEAKNGSVPMTVDSVQCFQGTSCWSGADSAASTVLQNRLLGEVSALPSMPNNLPALITRSNTSDFVNGGSYNGWYVLIQVPSGSCPDIGGVRYLNGGGSGIRSCRYALEVAS